MIINKIFIINLKQRTDRKNQMIQEMKKQNITNYEFFDAVRPTLSDVNKWNPIFCSHVKKVVHPSKINNYKIGCLGCMKSHIEIMKIALNRNYENILILEDDTEFIDDFTNLFKYSNQINNDYDLLYLSGSHIKPITNLNNVNNIKKTNFTLTTGSYCIKKNIMNYILQNINGYNKEIDSFYVSQLQNKFKCYVVIPHITKQKDGYSDIQQNNVSYRLQ